MSRCRPIRRPCCQMTVDFVGGCRPADEDLYRLCRSRPPAPGGPTVIGGLGGEFANRGELDIDGGSGEATSRELRAVALDGSFGKPRSAR